MIFQCLILLSYLLKLLFYLILLFLNAIRDLFELNIFILDYFDLLISLLHSLLKLLHVCLLSLDFLLWLNLDFLRHILCSITSTNFFICKFSHLVTFLLQHLNKRSLNYWCMITWAIIQKLFSRIILSWFFFAIELQWILLLAFNNIWRLSTNGRQKATLILNWILTKWWFSHDCYRTILSTLKIDPFRSQLRILGRSNFLLTLLLLIYDRMADI